MLKPTSSNFPVALAVITGIFTLLILPLIGNIHTVEFQAGRQLEFAGAPSGGGPSAESPGWSIVTKLVRILFRIAVVIFIYLFITDWRYRTLYLVVILFLFGVIIASELLGWDRSVAEEIKTPSSDDLWERPPEEDLNIQPVERDVVSSTIQYILLAIALSSFVVVACVMLWVKWLQPRPQSMDTDHAEIMGSITDAVHRLRLGEDAHTVVLFCYQEMIRVLSTVGKVDATYLTPREFEHRLSELGLSGVSIADLTKLFEIVRYAERANSDFAAQALTCLAAIQDAHAFNET